MSDLFKHVAPSECNIDYHNLMNFAKRLENQDIPMHSLTIMRGDKICMETYYAPYEKDTLHRMFSMTKTLVSLGIGKLYGEGKLSLDDHIVDYFKDKLPKEGAYEYTSMLTIRDMLKEKKKVNFIELFDNFEKPYVVVTFLSVLEMTKNREINIKQDNNFSDIYLERVD